MNEKVARELIKNLNYEEKLTLYEFLLTIEEKKNLHNQNESNALKKL